METINILGEMKEFVIDPVKEVNSFLINMSEQEKDELKRVGFDKQLKQELPQAVQNYKEKIYHIDEICKICVKYNFKFLEPKLYKGKVDTLLAGKLLAYRKLHTDGYTYRDKFKLLAPRESFLRVYDPDPILFYEIAEGYYGVVHQWGKDMTAMRRVRAFF